MNLFARILKIDAVNREVHGVMAEDARDKSGETFDYATSKPYVKAWSDGALQRTTEAGQEPSYGNVRSQHTSIAAGKLTSIQFDDANKCIPVVAKIVDDNEWKKVEEGVYTGFSIGGKYVKRWTDSTGAARYTAQPTEVSIVDNPCMYGARFTMVKADGVEEEREFPGEVIKRDELKKLGLELPAGALGFTVYGADGVLGKRYRFEQENSAESESEQMDLKKFEELEKNITKLQGDHEKLMKMSAENQAHLHAMLIHHSGMGSHLQAMSESGKAAGIEVAKNANETEAERLAKAAELEKKNKEAAAGASNAELEAVKKAVAELTELVKKIASQPVPSGAIATGKDTDEGGKRGGGEGEKKSTGFVPGGVEKSADADAMLRKSLDNGVPVDPRLRKAA